MSSFLELPSFFQLSFFHWGLALLAAFILGLSKSGIKGIAVVIVTIMAYVFGGKASTGVLVPMLIAADIFAVSYYHRHTQWKFLRRLLPWMMAGVLLGVWVGKDLPEDIFKQGMAVIILMTVGMMFWWDRRKDPKVPENKWLASVVGLAAGFTTMIGNLAGAFTNIYFLAMRLPKEQFIGTAAWLFFIINLFKLPFHIFVWETVSMETMALNIRLLPGIFLGLYTGIKLVKLIREKAYRQLILALTAIGAILIFFR